MQRHSVKFGHADPEIQERTDRQTYTFIAILCCLTAGGVKALFSDNSEVIDFAQSLTLNKQSHWMPCNLVIYTTSASWVVGRWLRRRVVSSRGRSARLGVLSGGFSE